MDVRKGAPSVHALVTSRKRQGQGVRAMCPVFCQMCPVSCPMCPLFGRMCPFWRAMCPVFVHMCPVLGGTPFTVPARRQAQVRLTGDAGMTGMCSVGRRKVFSFQPNVFSFWGNVFSFWPDVFSFRPNVFSSAGQVFSEAGERSERSRRDDVGQPDVWTRQGLQPFVDRVTGNRL